MENWTVLIIDDEEDILDILKFELELKGLEIIQSNNGLEAFEEIKKKTIHFVISDVRMPDCTGLDLLDLCKKENLKIPILLISGFSDISKEEALSKGAIGIESKFTVLNTIAERVFLFLKNKSDIW